MAIGTLGTTAGLMALKTAAAKGGATLGANALGQSALLSGAGTAIGALPDIIPSKYERDQKKRLREMQRKQEMGALGLTERERAAIESQMRGARQQAQQYAEAERARLTQPTAQPQMALLGQQMADEGRQRLEADLASQILGMDLRRQAQQEQEIRDLEAAQGEYRRRRAEGLTAPFQSAAEAYVSQMALERLLGQAAMAQTEQAKQVAVAAETAKEATRTALNTPDGQAVLQQVIGPRLRLSAEDLALFGSYQSNTPTMPTNISMAAPVDSSMATKPQTDTTVQDMLKAYLGGM
jgi:hypothetical protein